MSTGNPFSTSSLISKYLGTDFDNIVAVKDKLPELMRLNDYLVQLMRTYDSIDNVDTVAVNIDSVNTVALNISEIVTIATEVGELLTQAQEETLPLGSKIYPRLGYLENGQEVTAGTTHLRVLINGDTDIYDLGAVVTTARSDYGMGYRGSVIVDGIKLIVDPRDENGLGQSEDFAIVQYPPTSGTYNNIETHFHAPKKVVVKNLSVERVASTINTTKEFKISAFTMNRQGTQKPYYLPYDVIVDGMDCGDSDNIFFLGYNSQGAWENDNVSSQGAQKCKWTFKNINNKEFAWDWDAVPLIADKNTRLDGNAKVSVVYFGTRFGFTQTAASRAELDITIDNCNGWFYNNKYMGDLKITNSKMISCRTINPADVVGSQPNQVMSDCFVYPFPQDVNGGLDWQSTPVEGGLRMHHCSIRSMTMQTYGLVGEIYGNLYYFGDSNLVPTEMRQVDADLLWTPAFIYTNKYKVPTTP